MTIPSAGMEIIHASPPVPKKSLGMKKPTGFKLLLQLRQWPLGWPPLRQWPATLPPSQTSSKATAAAAKLVEAGAKKVKKGKAVPRPRPMPRAATPPPLRPMLWCGRRPQPATSIAATKCSMKCLQGKKKLFRISIDSVCLFCCLSAEMNTTEFLTSSGSSGDIGLDEFMRLGHKINTILVLLQ